MLDLHLEIWRGLFPRSSFCVLTNAALATDRNRTLARVARFLELAEPGAPGAVANGREREHERGSRDRLLAGVDAAAGGIASDAAAPPPPAASGAAAAAGAQVPRGQGGQPTPDLGNPGASWLPGLSSPQRGHSREHTGFSRGEFPKLDRFLQGQSRILAELAKHGGWLGC